MGKTSWGPGEAAKKVSLQLLPLYLETLTYIVSPSPKEDKHTCFPEGIASTYQMRGARLKSKCGRCELAIM